MGSPHYSYSAACLRRGRTAGGQTLFLPRFEKCGCASGCWCVLTSSYVPSSTYSLFRRPSTGIVPCWGRFGWVLIYTTGRHKCSQLHSDTYDIYYGNQGLIPQLQTDPAEENKSTPWTLDPDRGDATVEDICDFIVEYINSDVMVCLFTVLCALSSLPL
jgi:hypothetical protein